MLNTKSITSYENRKHVGMLAARLMLFLFIFAATLNFSPTVGASSTDTTIAFSDPPLNVTSSEGITETEPSIAISPVSPMTFLAGMNSTEGLFATRLSVNGGQDWYDAKLPPFAGPAQSDPVVGFDGDGKAYIAGISANLQCVPGIAGGFRILEEQSGGVFVASGNVNSGGLGTTPGITWSNTIIVESNMPGNITREPGDTGVLQDKPWLAIDSSSTSPFRNHVYLAWTSFYGDGTTIIWFTYSAGFGQSFAPKIPVAVATPDSGKSVTFSNLGVGPTGDLYIAWTEGPGDVNQEVVQRTLYMRHSGNGSTFDPGPAIKIADVDVPGVLSSNEFLCGGEGRILNGPIRDDVIPSVATDPTNPNRVYVVWNGASLNGDSDIYLSSSNNKGSDWSPPSTVNSITARDQFMPSVAVDKLGTVFVEWYDRKGDPSNLAFVPTAAYSRNGGEMFVQKALNPASYLGDFSFVYDYLQISAHPDGGAVDIWVGDGDAHISIAKYVAASPVDVYMLVDLTGSFNDDLQNFKIQASAVMSNQKAANPNSRFGLGKFEDYPISPFGAASFGDKAYERLVDLTFDTNSVLDAISGLFTRGGSDGPESQLVALYQAASGAGQDLSGVGYPGASIPAGQQANFRNGATKIFILWTDALFHRAGDPGDIPYPGPTFDDTVNAIQALDPPKVIGISSGGGGRADLEAIASATDAVAPLEGVDCDNDGIVDIGPGQPLVCEISSSGEGIGAAITALVEAASKPGDFSKVGPTNGSTDQPTSIMVSWEASSGVTSYEYCYDTTNDNNCDWIDNGIDTMVHLAGLSTNTTYYWHVRAINSTGVTYSNGDDDAFFSFTTVSAQPNTPIFADVPADHWARTFIETLYHAGITGGCATNPLRYCPEESVTRAQMAVFLERGIRGSTYTPPAVGTSTGFNDVSTNYWSAAWIKQLAVDGITGGCGSGIYCPDYLVTRAQMAVFLLRAKYGAGYTPPAVGASTGFSDVPTNYWSAAWIKQLAVEGITGGCGASIYCPESPVTRAQMAVFLVRTFSLP